MTISELGSIGELIAAVATIATLAYLGVQIRANTIATRSESLRGAASLRMQGQALISANREAASVFGRGLGDPRALDFAERIQFNFQFGILASIAESSFVEYEHGLIDFESLEAHSALMKHLLPTPGGRDYWQRYSANYVPSFRNYIQTVLEP